MRRAGTPDIQNQDEDTDIHALAKGLVYARTGIASYRSGVLAILKSAVGSESGGRTLAAARNIPGYVIAADLIDLNDYDPSFDTSTFRPWLRKLLTESLSGDDHRLDPRRSTEQLGHPRRGCPGGDRPLPRRSAQLARTSQVFHGWLGDRASYAGFKYGDLSWQCDSSQARRDQPDRLLEERPRTSTAPCPTTCVGAAGSSGRRPAPATHGRPCRARSCRR